MKIVLTSQSPCKGLEDPQEFPDHTLQNTMLDYKNMDVLIHLYCRIKTLMGTIIAEQSWSVIG